EPLGSWLSGRAGCSGSLEDRCGAGGGDWMTRDRRFKKRVRRRMRETGENYSAALAVERSTRPPPRKGTTETTTTKIKEQTMTTKPAVATRLRGVWFGVSDIKRSRAFYERLGAYFEDEPGAEGVVYATLGGMRLNFETSP